MGAGEINMATETHFFIHAHWSFKRVNNLFCVNWLDLKKTDLGGSLPLLLLVLGLVADIDCSYKLAWHLRHHGLAE